MKPRKFFNDKNQNIDLVIGIVYHKIKKLIY